MLVFRLADASFQFVIRNIHMPRSNSLVGFVIITIVPVKTWRCEQDTNNTLGIPVDVNGTDSSCTVGTSHPTPCCFIWHFDTLVGEVVSASKKRQNRSYRSVACHLIDRVSCSNQQVTSRPVALVWLMRIAVETAIVWTFEEVNLLLHIGWKLLVSTEKPCRTSDF